ncbi:MlaD family protein [Nocardia tengchongensis]|uniref:MlaD family protein n=1 Tax=Nocardia tengchongensis TaxID=2055889 RepID=UPI003697E5FE
MPVVKKLLERLGPINRLPIYFRLPPLSEMWESVPSYSRNRHWWLGLTAGAVVGLLLLGSSVLSRAGIGERTVHAEFAQAAGLRVGDGVDIAGIEVGTVRSARLAGDRVDIGLSIRKDVALGPDVQAEIKMSTILGKMHVELTLGAATGAVDRIPLERTRVPYNLAKVVNDPTYTHAFEHLERVDTRALRDSLDAVARQMGDSPALTAQALDSVGVLSKIISDRRDEVGQLLKNIDVVAKLVSDNRNSVLLLLTRGQAVGDAVAGRQKLLTQLLDAIASASKELQDMGIQDKGRLGPLIHDLETMSDGLQKNRDNLDRLFQIMPVTVRQFNNTLGNGPYGDVYAPWLFPDNWLCATAVVQGCR